MGRRSHHALIACALATATGCTFPRAPLSDVSAEVHYLGAYAEGRSRACGSDATFELVLHERPKEVIETDPPIDESQWDLTACGQTLRFTIDCRTKGDARACWAHDWPTPAVPPEYPLAREIDAVARRAPPCPSTALVLRRTASHADHASYEISRCGMTTAVNVRCTREQPIRCVTLASPAAPTPAR